jgi:hypothetical protein
MGKYVTKTIKNESNILGFKTIEEYTLFECEDYLKRTDISESERQRADWLDWK